MDIDAIGTFNVTKVVFDQFMKVCSHSFTGYLYIAIAAVVPFGFSKHFPQSVQSLYNMGFEYIHLCCASQIFLPW